jgi:hypothetical protein
MQILKNLHIAVVKKVEVQNTVYGCGWGSGIMVTHLETLKNWNKLN